MRVGPLNLADRRTGWALLGVALVFLLVYPEFESTYHIYVMASLFLTAILVTSLNLSMGYAGLPNFVTTGLYAFAAYGSGILAVRFHWSVPLAMVAGIVASTVFGALIAATSLRASYLYFGMATLAFDLIIVAVADQWTSITGGDTGLSGVPRLIVGGYVVKSYGMYHLALAVLVVCVLFLWNLVRSQTGRRIRAVAQSAEAASSLGIPPAATRVLAFTLAAAMSGMAGVLYAHFNQFVSPSLGDFGGMLTLFIALLLGGSGTIVGPLLGTLIAVLLDTNLQAWLAGSPQLAARHLIVFAAILFVIVVVFPEGLAGRWRRLLESRRDFRLGERDEVAAGSDVTFPALGEDVPATVLTVSGLRHRFGGVAAVDGVDLEVERGAIHGLIGPNGSGKSTTVNLITGALRIQDGSVAFLGSPPGRTHEAARRGLIRVYQIPHVFMGMTVLENVMTGLSRHYRGNLLVNVLRTPGMRREERQARERAVQLLRAAGLAEMADWPSAVLSHGQKRLVEVVRAMAAEPVLLVLDEPATGLTASEVTNLARLLRALQASGVAILLIEHNLEFVLGVSDQVTALDQGRVIARGRPAEVRQSDRLQRAYLGMPA